MCSSDLGQGKETRRKRESKGGGGGGTVVLGHQAKGASSSELLSSFMNPLVGHCMGTGRQREGVDLRCGIARKNSQTVTKHLIKNVTAILIGYKKTGAVTRRYPLMG